MPQITATKYPTEVRKVIFDFSLLEEFTSDPPDTISSPSITASPDDGLAGLHFSGAAVSQLHHTVTTTCSGGVAGRDYTVVCTIHTSSGATLAPPFTICVPY